MNSSEIPHTSFSTQLMLYMIMHVVVLLIPYVFEIFTEKKEKNLLLEDCKDSEGKHKEDDLMFFVCL